jgi:hypothetical protein
MTNVAIIRRIEEYHQLAKQSTGLDAGRSSLEILAPLDRDLPARPHYLAVAAALQRQQRHQPQAGHRPDPITVPELLRLLRGTVIAPPRTDRAHRLYWSIWRRRHRHRAR